MLYRRIGIVLLVVACGLCVTPVSAKKQLTPVQPEVVDSLSYYRHQLDSLRSLQADLLKRCMSTTMSMDITSHYMDSLCALVDLNQGVQDEQLLYMATVLLDAPSFTSQVERVQMLHQTLAQVQRLTESLQAPFSRAKIDSLKIEVASIDTMSLTLEQKATVRAIDKQTRYAKLSTSRLLDVVRGVLAAKDAEQFDAAIREELEFTARNEVIDIYLYTRNTYETIKSWIPQTDGIYDRTQIRWEDLEKIEKELDTYLK